jgi:hypothetical protein
MVSRKSSMILRTVVLQVFLSVALAPALLADSTGWSATAAHHRGENGKRFRYNCGAGGPLHKTWGTDVYIDNSSVCTAAVHAGLILQNTGGNVVIEIRPGRQSYSGSARNGVRTLSYESWQGSFVFTGERAVNGVESTTTWATTASNHRGQNGKRFNYNCPGNGSPNDVWGTGVYTDDSSVCTAAVHHGLIGFAGGSITIEIRPGQSSYRGSSGHGVQSENYGAFSGSFMFLR